MTDPRKQPIIEPKEPLGESGGYQTTTQDLGSDSRGKSCAVERQAKDARELSRLSREARAQSRAPLPDENPRKQIRKFCLECVGGSSDLVKYCTGFNCPLWKLRFGKAPATVERKNPELLNVEFVREKAMAKK